MKYPYYIVPDVEKYRELNPDSKEAQFLSRKIAANVGDLASLRLVLGIDPPEFGRFYPDMENNTPSTMDTIDTFLDKFGGNITSGYLTEENIELPSDSRLFYESTQENEENIEEPKEEIDFGILIKEKRFEEAISFIEQQNLINPDKSIYFAHQIRFIKKLMAIENYRKQTMG